MCWIDSPLAALAKAINGCLDGRRLLSGGSAGGSSPAPSLRARRAGSVTTRARWRRGQRDGTGACSTHPWLAPSHRTSACSTRGRGMDIISSSWSSSVLGSPRDVRVLAPSVTKAMAAAAQGVAGPARRAPELHGTNRAMRIAGASGGLRERGFRCRRAAGRSKSGDEEERSRGGAGSLR